MTNTKPREMPREIIDKYIAECLDGHNLEFTASEEIALNFAYQAALEEMSSLRSENEALKAKVARYEIVIIKAITQLGYNQYYNAIDTLESARQALGEK